jgi:hypothetical protein
LNFGQTIMPLWSGLQVPSFRGRASAVYARVFEFRDLPLLKRAGKGIVVTYQGNDARQGDYSTEHFEISIAREVTGRYYTSATDRAKRHRIQLVDQYADAIFALNPDLLHVLPPRSEFLPYSAVDIRNWAPVMSRSDPPLVIHAPTNRAAKGTRFILEAVECLRAEGVRFDFLLVEGLTRNQARAVYERADLLVDQLLAGWYGGLAVELMALGKPVIAYIRREDLARVPVAMRDELPIIEARPDTFLEILRRWLTTDREQLPEVGRRSRAYVERWHDPLVIAKRTKATYEEILGFPASPSGRQTGGSLGQ